MGEERLVPIASYCVRVDHVVAMPAMRPVITMHQDGWAYCRSGRYDEDHLWAPTHGAPIRALYRDPSFAREGSVLEVLEATHEDLRDALGVTSCVFEIARSPHPLRVSFDEAVPGTEPLGARVELDFRDAMGSVGLLTACDRRRDEFTGVDVAVIRALVAPYAAPIRTWLEARERSEGPERAASA